MYWFHLFVLHVAFKGRIQHVLDRFRRVYNAHRLRTEGRSTNELCNNPIKRVHVVPFDYAVEYGHFNAASSDNDVCVSAIDGITDNIAQKVTLWFAQNGVSRDSSDIDHLNVYVQLVPILHQWMLEERIRNILSA